MRRPVDIYAERVTEDDLAGPLAPQWEALHQRLTPRLPFSSPLWNRLWWKHCRSERLSVRDELFLLAVRDASGSLLAVAPMMSTERPSIGPLRVRILQCFGTDPNITELRSIVCMPEDQTDVLRAIRRYLQKQGQRWDWIDWGALRDQNWSSVASMLPAGASLSSQDIHDYHLDLPATWEELRASRSRNIKESLRKCYNSLKRDGLTPELRVIQSPAQVAEGLATFFELHAARSRSDAAVQHADVFRKSNARDFLLEYATALAERDQLRIFQLVLAGKVVATRLGFLFGEELYLYYSGYAPAFAKYSVMTTLVAEALKWSIEQQLRIVNLSTGTDVSKLRWSPVDTHFRTLTEIQLGWRATLSFEAYRRARRVASRSSLGPIGALLRR